jgi:hypothetical protein
MQDRGRAGLALAARAPASCTMERLELQLRKNRRLIAELAANDRLPTIYVSKEYIDAGGLIAYGPSFVFVCLRDTLWFALAVPGFIAIDWGQEAGLLPVLFRLP